MAGEEGVVVIGRAVIDTRAPFRSVKEAVLLFGERVLVGEVYANKLKQMQPNNATDNQKEQRPSRQEAVIAPHDELEEMRQSLQKAREERDSMAIRMESMRAEVEQAKAETLRLRAEKSVTQRQPPMPMDPEIEDVKFIEIASKAKVPIWEATDEPELCQKKRYVSFASPPSLSKVIVSQDGQRVVQGRASPQKSLLEKKKKPLVPLAGWIFPKKHGSKHN